MHMYVHTYAQSGLAGILVGLDELNAVVSAQKHTAWRKQYLEEEAELRKESSDLNVYLAQMKSQVQKTEDPAEGWKIFSRIQQKFDRLHSRLEDLCTRAGLRSKEIDEAKTLEKSATKIQAHKRGKNARRDLRKAAESAGARAVLLDVDDASGGDVQGDRAAIL
jgi:hypothetical protein